MSHPIRQALALAALAAIHLPALAQAQQIYGSLANFDAVNKTGYEAHGFEIRIDDSRYGDPNANLIGSIFGYDRNFGVPPESVERYGAPTVTLTQGVGAVIRYEASFADGAWSVGTPTGNYANAGDSCWALGNPLYASGTLACDHFGVGTYGTPASTSYSWLVDTGGNTGVLTAVTAEVPAVVFNYIAPVVQHDPVLNQDVVIQPAEVEARIEAPRNDDGGIFGTPYWVQIYAHKLDHNVELGNLMQGNADVPGETEIETEFAIFQAGDNENEVQRALARLDPGDQSLVMRFEFYRYIGALKADGSVDCSGKGGGGQNDPDRCGGLGEYVGAQMAGFNVVEAPLPDGVVLPLGPVAPVPEPHAWATMLAGLVFLGARLRRKRG